jgi:hypothetical protein
MRKITLDIHKFCLLGRHALSGVWRNRSRLMEVGVHEVDVGPYMLQISRDPGKCIPSARRWRRFAQDLVLSSDSMHSINTQHTKIWAQNTNFGIDRNILSRNEQRYHDSHQSQKSQFNPEEWSF